MPTFDQEEMAWRWELINTHGNKEYIWSSELYQICQDCNLPAVRTITKYGLRDECNICGRIGWGGKDLVTKDVLAYRRKAHIAFDALWKTPDGIFYVKEDLRKGYKKALEFIAMKLSRLDLVNPNQSHIGRLNAKECQQLIEAVEQLLS